ncbi:hypothetical protein [Streptomyces sp. NEAU-H3]|uniref:hypothetical protein n=1 Tax=unclassified Streptomyces TaxID=2593676 RepID=UPI001439F667|nr:hypothetical protein [Streptomyces sp. NEAU-H3]NJA55069.1 hypothetical protein [Streptomyces sp. NEAU-H3]
MEMSEPYATTIAAVAPVIWAIGTVEVQQVVKRVWTVRDERDHSAAECLDAIALVGDDADLVQARRDWESVGRQNRRALPSILLYVAWICMGLTMILCVINALSWLAESGGPGKISGADPATAEFCLQTITAGLVFITFLPVVTTTTEAVRSLRRDRSRRRDFITRDTEAVSRLDARRSTESAMPSASLRCP